VRSVNTAVEFAKVRQALNLVEAHVSYIQRSPASSVPIPSSQPSFDAHGGVLPITFSQLKPDLTKSDLSEQEAAPGARGQSNQRGLYAGSTSAASHLTSVCFLRVAIPRILELKCAYFLNGQLHPFLRVSEMAVAAPR
jgi:hypothetical protein